jgi:hypothetical protein
MFQICVHNHNFNENINLNVFLLIKKSLMGLINSRSDVLSGTTQG